MTAPLIPTTAPWIDNTGTVPDGPGHNDMSPERIAVLLMLRAMGWTAERTRQGKSVIWKFTRPDTGGMYDVIRVNHKALSWGWLIWRCHQEDGMREAMDRAARLWLRDNYPRYAPAVQP